MLVTLPTFHTHRTYVQAIGSVCRHAGHRFGDHVERVVAVVLRLLNKAGSSADADEELREHCLQVQQLLLVQAFF